MNEQTTSTVVTKLEENKLSKLLVAAIKLCGDCNCWKQEEKRDNTTNLRYGHCEKLGVRTERCRTCKIKCGESKARMA